MAKVVAKEFKDERGRKTHESLDSLLKRFKRKVANEGIIQSMKDKEYFETRGEKRRLALDAARRREARNKEKEKFKDDVAAGKVHPTKTQLRKYGLGR